MAKSKTRFLVGLSLVLAGGLIYSLLPDRWLDVLPTWVRVVLICSAVLAFLFDLAVGFQSLGLSRKEKHAGTMKAEDKNEA